jgi:NTE family protein
MKIIKILFLFITLLPSIIACNILTLSGGGAHGAFQAGVIQKILLKENHKWDYIFGVSAGGLNAGFLATRDPNYWNNEIESTLRQVWYNTKNNDILHFSFDDISIFKQKPIKNLIESITNNTVGYNFIPSYVGITDLNTGKFFIQLITQQNIINSLLATSAIPVVFRPVLFDNIIGTDGGVESNEIINQAVSFCPKGEPIHMDIIICTPPKLFSDININIISIASRTIDIIVNNFNDLLMKGLLDCKSSINTARVYLPKNDTLPWSSLDFDHGEELWNLDYKYKDFYLC